MTDDAYREDDEKDELVKNKKKYGEKKDDEKKKSVAFKASTSKGKAKIESSSEGKARCLIVMTMRKWLFLSRYLENS